MRPKVTEVFTPGSFPTKTYVQRVGAGLEQALKDALDTPGQVVSLVGPSKSGKTVLVERVVGRDELIPVTGAGVSSVEDIWDRVLDWMGVPSTSSKGSCTSGTVGGEVGAIGSASFLGLAKAEGEARGQASASHSRDNSQGFERAGLEQVAKEIANSDYVVLLDDFHYMPRGVQAEAAKSLKEAVRRGVKVCTASVVHRGDDLVRANPELRGRVRAIDLRYWAREDLAKIASAGFSELNLDVNEQAVQRVVAEAAGSPQLMQLLCLHSCFVLGYRERQSSRTKVTPQVAQIEQFFEQASASTDFRSLVDILDAGPKTRGTERRIYKFKDATTGDVYRCVLKAIAADPPRLSFNYEDLTRRTAGVCVGDSPVGSSVVGTCLHMAKLALEKFPHERAIDWDEQKQILDVPDPYLLFFLRWSGRLRETEDE